MTLTYGPKVLAGVFFASFILNLGFSGASLFEPSTAWIVAAGIAAGAALQGALANWAIRRWTRYPELISRSSDAIYLGLLGGPLACLCSPSIRVLILVGFQLVPLESSLLNWFHWWVGDSVGVLIFAPVLLAFSLRKRWSGSRKTATFFSLYLVLIAVAMALFAYAKNKEEAKNELVFRQQAERYVGAIRNQLASTQHISQSLVAMFETFTPIDHGHFQTYAASIFPYIPGIRALSWIPIVTADQRNAMEDTLSQIHNKKMFFFQAGKQELEAMAMAKERYYPVYYIYPIATNETAIGFDLGSHPERLEALMQTKSSGQHTVTAPIVLIQKQDKQKGFLLFAPIKAGDKSITGFISTVYLARELIAAAIGTEAMQYVAIQIDDVSQSGKQPLFTTDVEGGFYTLEENIQYAGRQWQIIIQPSLERIKHTQNWWVWGILISAFLFVTLFGLFLLLLISRTAAIEQEVSIKTYALKKALSQAERSSQVKSSFLASMSHELRTPLNSIIGFSVRLIKGLQGQVDEKYIASLVIIERNGQHLLALINDILDLSKVEAGKMTISKQFHPVAPLIQEVVEALTPAAENKHLTLEAAPCPIDDLYIDRKRFVQIITNLIGNAVKFTETGSVRVQYQLKTLEVPGLEIEIKDTGRGIPKYDIPKLFRRYEQLGDTFQGGEIGTGLGLALVQELVKMHDGQVYVSSELNQGTSFYVWFPIQKRPT